MLLRALLAFLALPSVFAFLVPWSLLAVDPWRGGVRPWGAAVMAIGLLLLLWCVRDFYVSGKGTLAPWDPPRRLVIVGLYRFTRNPMYVGVLLLIAGWAILYASPLVGAYLLVVAFAFHLRVVVNEEPWLSSRFGEDWQAYSRAVPRWAWRLGASRAERPNSPG